MSLIFIIWLQHLVGVGHSVIVHGQVWNTGSAARLRVSHLENHAKWFLFLSNYSYHVGSQLTKNVNYTNYKFEEKREGASTAEHIIPSFTIYSKCLVRFLRIELFTAAAEHVFSIPLYWEIIQYNSNHSFHNIPTHIIHYFFGIITQFFFFF